MFDEISEWLDDVLEQILDTGIPNEVIAFGFNLYDDDGDDWSMELIGASEFATDDEQDYGKAVFWYRKAAEQGNEVAQTNLAECYEDGEGVEQNLEQGMKGKRFYGRVHVKNEFCGIGGTAGK